MDSEVGSHLLDRHARTPVPRDTDDILAELFRIRLGHSDILPTRPAGQASSDVTRSCGRPKPPGLTTHPRPSVHGRRPPPTQRTERRPRPIEPRPTSRTKGCEWSWSTSSSTARTLMPWPNAKEPRSARCCNGCTPMPAPHRTPVAPELPAPPAGKEQPHAQHPPPAPHPKPPSSPTAPGPPPPSPTPQPSPSPSPSPGSAVPPPRTPRTPPSPCRANSETPEARCRPAG